MKKYLLTILIALPFFIPHFAHADITSNLKLWWKFDEGTGTTVTDSSGNGNTGTISSGTWVPGKIGPHAISNPSVTSSGLPSNATDNVTMSIWVYETTPNGALSFPGFNGNGGTDGWGFIISDGSCGSGNSVAILLGAVFCNALNTTYAIPIGQWTLLTIERDSGTWKLFVNGALQIVGGTVSPNTPTVAFNTTFPGIVDDVRLYDRALSGPDVNELYNASINRSFAVKGVNTGNNVTNGLVDWYKMDENTGSTAFDSVGSEDETFSGFPSWTTGKYNSGLSFGGNDSLTGSTGKQWPQAGFTVSTWVNTTYTSLQIPGAAYDSGVNGYMQFILDGTAISLQMQGVHVDTDTINNAGPCIYADGNWHLVTATWNGATTPDGIRIYCDGVEVENNPGGSGSFTGPYSGSAVPLSIATQYNAQYPISFGGFVGSMDDFRIYDRALSPSEVSDLYNYGNKVKNNYQKFLVKLGSVFRVFGK